MATRAAIVRAKPDRGIEGKWSLYKKSNKENKTMYIHNENKAQKINGKGRKGLQT